MLLSSRRGRAPPHQSGADSALHHVCPSGRPANRILAQMCARRRPRGSRRGARRAPPARRSAYRPETSATVGDLAADAPQRRLVDVVRDVDPARPQDAPHVVSGPPPCPGGRARGGRRRRRRPRPRTSAAAARTPRRGRRRCCTPGPGRVEPQLLAGDAGPRRRRPEDARREAERTAAEPSRERARAAAEMQDVAGPGASPRALRRSSACYGISSAAVGEVDAPRPRDRRPAASGACRRRAPAPAPAAPAARRRSPPAAHRAMSPSSARAITSRWISLVPS